MKPKYSSDALPVALRRTEIARMKIAPHAHELVGAPPLALPPSFRSAHCSASQRPPCFLLLKVLLSLAAAASAGAERTHSDATEEAESVAAE